MLLSPFENFSVGETQKGNKTNAYNNAYIWSETSLDFLCQLYESGE